jgi:hypothetical protein
MTTKQLWVHFSTFAALLMKKLIVPAVAVFTAIEIVLFEIATRLEKSSPTLAFSIQGPSPSKTIEGLRHTCDATSSDGAHALPDGSYSAWPPALNDVTIKLSPCVDRPWIRRPEGRFSKDRRSGAAKRPPYKILLTNFCFNNPDQWGRGLRCIRSIRSRELLQAIVDHPYFDPVDWSDLNRRIARHGNETATRSYVFLDLETCYETNYPTYGNQSANWDHQGGRNVSPMDGAPDSECDGLERCSSPIQRVLKSPLFRRFKKLARLVYVECVDSAPLSVRQQFDSDQFSLVSITASKEQHDLKVDQGLPPPAVAKIELADEEVREIESCRAEATSNRPYLFSFVGSVFNQARRDLVDLHDPASGVVSLRIPDFQDKRESGELSVTFSELLRHSAFAAAPIGDNLFSYRFTEVLSAGAIPVVHSDGWVLPFRQELVNWTECLLHLPEASASDTLRILRSISPQQRCRMRRRCREIYTSYMATADGTIRGIIDGLELVVG